MPINQAAKDKPVFCISCGKMICKGHMESGSIEIPCKCGVKNRIEAENKPEGRRMPGGFQSEVIMPMRHETAAANR